MNYLGQTQWPVAINTYFQKGKPFFFIISFDRKKAIVLEVDDCDQYGILFDFKNITNHVPGEKSSSSTSTNSLTIEQVPQSDYKNAFDEVMEHIRFGNTYLINLCHQSKISLPYSLKEIFSRAKAPYKLLMGQQFVVFSPEPFIEIKDGWIYTYPMKGTIDANIPKAARKLRNDQKELAEHYTIVDLLRNDLGSVCSSVEVDDFAYIEKFITQQGPILQMSSKIKGKLRHQFLQNPGDLLETILPAGSISGAPKEKTLEIIDEVEKFDRGFYTGIMGYSDGTSFETAVMIRFIEKDKNGSYWYKSGGGITHLSKWKKEFDELNRKIYLPFL
jgi:para-aminobenzoate synthetase component 1